LISIKNPLFNVGTGDVHKVREMGRKETHNFMGVPIFPYIYHQDIKGKPREMDLPLMRGNITTILSSQKPVIYCRYPRSPVDDFSPQSTHSCDDLDSRFKAAIMHLGSKSQTARYGTSRLSARSVTDGMPTEILITSIADISLTIRPKSVKRFLSPLSGMRMIAS
jgi:hypothetical protein